ncbi:hypothetical protein GLI01_19700 [Gluconacetobacter liquefaciens]|uniref:Uncharacterized protein n=1 Tax=Gluconacetobacter liquefaciens TaxID=89584 RepID=A0A370G0F8_GLULI|nr:hypothetical protein C7453_11046 [Gluconacetobacter liquefaciens]GBQ92330.1 hypothetical protein AA0522_0039 [Gluconacetobacter liquefaciens NRIC 0522]GEB37935.1 hypothetical protein GLI01_19700 [Gluconacetobacter liquefaciens]
MRQFTTLNDREILAFAISNEDEDARRRVVLQVIQPGLVGLMDGSVSTLAPVLWLQHTVPERITVFSFFF